MKDGEDTCITICCEYECVKINTERGASTMASKVARLHTKNPIPKFRTLFKERGTA